MEPVNSQLDSLQKRHVQIGKGVKCMSTVHFLPSCTSCPSATVVHCLVQKTNDEEKEKNGGRERKRKTRSELLRISAFMPCGIPAGPYSRCGCVPGGNINPRPPQGPGHQHSARPPVLVVDLM